MPWYADPEWFRLLAAEGWPHAAPRLLPVDHLDGKTLPLVELGAGRCQGLSNYYSPLLEPAGGEGLQDPSGLVAAWCRAGVAVLDLQPLDADATWLGLLRAALQRQGFWVFDQPAFGNWTLPVTGEGAAAYLASRPGPLRTSLQRGKARLTRAGNWNLSLVTEPGPALEAALGDYEQVYARSWKPQETCPGFIRSLARWMAQRGCLRMGLLHLDGRPLAAQIWFVEDGVASIYKLAYDAEQTSLSPGTVLTAYLMQRVIDVDQVHLVDFLSGDDAYKRDWMAVRRQRVGLLACRRLSPLGLYTAARFVAARRWGRQAAPNPPEVT